MRDELENLKGDQVAALEAVKAWYKQGSRRPQVFGLGGLAGTGKTWLIPHITRELGVEAVYGAPTNKAAAVLKHKLAMDAEVHTHHALTYVTLPVYRCRHTGVRLREKNHVCDQGERCVHPREFEHPCSPGQEKHRCPVVTELPTVIREKPKQNGGLIILDEASMLTEQQVRDTMTFKLPVLLVGDFGQLPPVDAGMNPWMLEAGLGARMTHIVRQDDGSPITLLAHQVRTGGRPQLGWRGDTLRVMRLKTDEFDVLGDLLYPGRFDPGPEKAVLVPTNKLRARINRKYHEGYHGDALVSVGDRVTALRRHAGHLLVKPVSTVAEAGKVRGAPEYAHNGTTGHVVDVVYEGDELADMLVKEDPPGGRLLLMRRVALIQFGQERPLEEHQYPRGAGQWDYAYATTVHKAQGSEYDDVVVYGEPGMGDYNRWMYTAITRAKKRLIVAVN